MRILFSLSKRGRTHRVKKIKAKKVVQKTKIVIGVEKTKLIETRQLVS